MRQKRFLSYLGIQVLVILSVVVIFKTISDVRQASVTAGTLFVLMPFMMMLAEYRQTHFHKKIFFAGLLQFWLLFALPILGLRLTHWEAPFNTLSFLGVPGPVLHQYANSSYLIMMVSTGLTWWRSGKRSGEETAAISKSV